MIGGPPGKRIVIFRYSPSRSGDVVSQFIGDYTGCIQTDGYKGYDFLDGKESIIHAGCWAQARRKFIDVQRLGNKSKHKRLQ